MNKFPFCIVVLFLHIFLNAFVNSEPALKLQSNPITHSSTPFFLNPTKKLAKNQGIFTISGTFNQLSVASTITDFSYKTSISPVSPQTVNSSSFLPHTASHSLLNINSLESRNIPHILSLSFVLQPHSLPLDASAAQPFQFTYDFTKEKSNEPKDLINIPIQRLISAAEQTTWDISIVIKLENIHFFDRYKLASILEINMLTSEALILNASDAIYYQVDPQYKLNEWYAVSDHVQDPYFRFSIGIQSQNEGEFLTGGYWTDELDSNTTFDEFADDDHGALVPNFGPMVLSLQVFTTHPTDHLMKPAWGFTYSHYDELDVQFYPTNLQFTNCLLGSIPVIMNIDPQFLNQPRVQKTHKTTSTKNEKNNVSGDTEVQNASDELILPSFFKLVSQPIPLTKQVYDAVKFSQLTCNDIYLTPPIVSKKQSTNMNTSEITSGNSADPTQPFEAFDHFTAFQQDAPSSSNLNTTYPLPTNPLFSDVFIHYEIEFNNIQTNTISKTSSLTVVEFYSGFFPQLVYPNKVRRDISIRYPPPLGDGHSGMNPTDLAFAQKYNDKMSQLKRITNDNKDTNEPFTTWANLYTYDIVYPSSTLDTISLQQFQTHKWYSPAFFTRQSSCKDNIYPLYCRFPQDLTANILKYIPLCPIQGDQVRTLPIAVVNTTINSYDSTLIFNKLSDAFGYTTPFSDFFRNEPYLFTPYYRLIFTDYRWLDRYFPYQQNPTTQLYLSATLHHHSTQTEKHSWFSFQSSANIGNSKYFRAKSNLPSLKLPVQQPPLSQSQSRSQRITLSQNDSKDVSPQNFELFFTTHMYTNSKFNSHSNIDADQNASTISTTFTPSTAHIASTTLQLTTPQYSVLRVSTLLGLSYFSGTFQSCQSSTHAPSQYQIESVQDFISSDTDPKYDTIFITFKEPTSVDFILTCPDAFVLRPDIGTDTYFIDAISISSNVFAGDITPPPNSMDIKNKNKLFSTIRKIGHFGSPITYSNIIVGNEILEVSGNPIRWTRDGMGFPTSAYGRMKIGTSSFLLSNKSIGYLNAIMAAITIPFWIILITLMIRTYISYSLLLKPNFIIQINDEINELPTFIDLHQFPHSQHKSIVESILSRNKQMQIQKHQQEIDFVQILPDEDEMNTEDAGMLFLSSPILSRFR